MRARRRGDAQVTLRRADPPSVDVAHLDAIPLAAFVVGGDGRVGASNARCRALFAGEDDVVGLAVADLLPDEPTALETLRAAAREGSEVRVHARRRNGVPVAADVACAPLGATGALLCTIREVREARLLSESQRYLDVAFATAPIGMALFDTDGRYVRVNPALCALLGRTPEELLGTRDNELTHPDDRHADVEAAWRILNGEQSTWQTEKRFLRPGGEVVWAIANMAFLRDDAGRPLCWLGQFQDITARKAQEERLRHLADHDELTGVANRRRLLRELATRLRHARRYGDRGAVILLDLDGFKEINDACGHEAGDRVLVEVARALCGRVRDTDVVGRLGGDEFAVLLPHADADRATVVAAAILDAVRCATPYTVTGSVGIALYGPDRLTTPERVLADADGAMYAAKASGRDSAVVADAGATAS